MGKYSYKWLPLQDGYSMYLYGILRNTFFTTMFVLAMEYNYNVFFGNVSVSIVLQFFLAFTNGHFTTTCFANAPNRVTESNKKFTGFIMVLAL